MASEGKPMTVTVNLEDVGETIGAALMQSIDQERRDVLLKAAIAHVLAPGEGYGGRREPSPLQKAFNWAVERYATKYVEQQLESDGELSKQLTSVIEEAVRTATVTEREKLVEKIAKSIADAFGPRY